MYGVLLDDIYLLIHTYSVDVNIIFLYYYVYKLWAPDSAQLSEFHHYHYHFSSIIAPIINNVKYKMYNDNIQWDINAVDITLPRYICNTYSPAALGR